ncbi:MAG: ATP-dependent Clp protease proteolytic subunit 2 [Candidatus Izimaplasma bacterium HR2]|nr:MAG: ATP-dependent Clp protease proteolytic subunit 2 [Candidatus Izimaplasma bacterium HR2]
MEFNFERDIYLFGDVNKEIAFKIIERINILNRYDEEMLRNGPRTFKPQPISLHINSGGGSIYDGMALYSTIKNSVTPVITIGSGMVGSAALLIYLGGRYRVVYPYTTFLFHSPKWGVVGTPYEVHNFNEEYNRMYLQLIEITQKECNLSNEIINRIYREDLQLYMDPKEALSVGICDFIYDLEEMDKEAKKEKAKVPKEIIDAIKAMAKEEEKNEEPKESEEVKEEVSKESEKETEKVQEEVKETEKETEEIQEEVCQCDYCKKKRGEI